MSGNRTDTRTDCLIEEKYDCGCLMRTVFTKNQDSKTKIYCEKHCTGQSMTRFEAKAISAAAQTSKMPVGHLINILEHPEFADFIKPFSQKVAKERSAAENEKMEKKRASVFAMLDKMNAKKSKTDDE